MNKARAIAAQLRAEILDETIPPGGRVPSEAQLIARFGVAQPTVRRALDILKGEGLVYARHGAGTFARPREQSGPLPPLPPLPVAVAAVVPELIAWFALLADQPRESQPGLALWSGVFCAYLHEAAADALVRAGQCPRDPLASGPIREAMVLGFTQGVFHGRAGGDDVFPADSGIVDSVLRGALSAAETFPHLDEIARREMIPRADPVLTAWLREQLGLPPAETDSPPVQG